MSETTHHEQNRERNREQWRSHIEAWLDGGQTRAAYCEQHGLNLHTFGYWRQRLKTDSTSVRLVQLPTGALRQPEESTLRLVVDDRLAIEVSDGFNPATLGRVLEVLRGL